MTLRKTIATALGIVIAVSLVSVWFYPSITDFMRANPFWNGLRDFSRDFEVDLVESLAGVSEDAEGTTLIAIPYARYATEDLEAVAAFVREGGFLVLADDYGYGNDLLSEMGLRARFSGKPLLDPLYAHRNEWLPRITDFDAALVSAGIRVIALNHGTALVGVQSSLAQAWSSETSFLDLNGNGAFDDGEQHGPFPVAAAVPLGTGTVLLLSDPSILINSMVGRDDNRAFVEQLMRRHGSGRERLLDASHLSRSTLDQSKLRLMRAREGLSHPFSAAILLGAVVFLAVAPQRRRNPS